MNPLTNVKNIQKLNETELKLGTVGKKSWHDQYKDSAWIFIGGLPYDLTEGDILAVFSQYGEIVNINLIRDKQSGKSKGYGFLCFEDQRSTVLSVDNLNSIKILGRTIRVDHVEAYKKPKEHENDDDVTKLIRKEGCAPTVQNQSVQETEPEPAKVKKDKHKSKKKKKEKKKKIKSEDSSSSANESESPVKRNHGNTSHIKIKNEKYDSGYEKALNRDDRSKRETSKTDPGSHGDTNHPGHDRHTESRRDGDRERKRETNIAYEFENKRQKMDKHLKHGEDRHRDCSGMYDRDSDRHRDSEKRRDSDKHRYEKWGGHDNDERSDRRRESHHDGRR
ncbi:RNA-binding motif protein, X-linked 2-like [Gigantopelta aegis]|uniref:RNA-binding motif protein, X-linked 2-like n=1 Tax=Gigantopelta aegis TaxID=1735272 RepID=UPI001B88BCB1|nr:RNA-binding motif protein, X-linked 2-like [Gigantopelta aegis]